jgi:ribosomal protein L27
MRHDHDERIRLLGRAQLRGELTYPGLDDPQVCRQRGLRLWAAVEAGAGDDTIEKLGGFTSSRICYARRVNRKAEAEA